jgi:hypothetical protein
MTATLTEITEAVAATLRTIDDVYVHDAWEGDTQLPALIVLAPSVPNYRETFGATTGPRSLELEVLALAAPSDQSQLLYAQRTLHELADWTGTKSVNAAINADPTLGSVVAQCFVDSFDRLGTEDVHSVGHWAGLFRLKIQAVR